MADSRRPSLLAACTVTYVLAVIAVSLRFTARKIRGVGYWYDDWFMFTALLCSTGFFVDIVIWIHRGYGDHYQYYGPNVFYHFFLGLFVGEITYTGVICFVKYSTLCLYWRVFGGKNIQYQGIIMGIITTCWGLAVIITSCLQCIPTRGFWDKSIQASCKVNNREFLLGISLPNIFTDAMILSIPIPFIRRLNTNRTQKLLLTGTFLLGGIVCIASIFRFISVISVDETKIDLTYNFTNVGIWTAVEGNLAIISACLPCLKPIWTAISQQLAHKTKNSSSGRSSNKLWSIPLSQNRFLGIRQARQQQSSITQELDTNIDLDSYDANSNSGSLHTVHENHSGGSKSQNGRKSPKIYVMHDITVVREQIGDINSRTRVS